MRVLVKMALAGMAAAAFCSGQAMAADSLPAGNAAAGKTVFNTCAACHSVAPGVNQLGPSLAGVVGRRAGTLPGYNYSPAMKAANRVWTRAELNAYLINPRAHIPGIKMFFPGLPSAQDRANVIAYLAASH